jgi:hypothetical protein
MNNDPKHAETSSIIVLLNQPENFEIEQINIFEKKSSKKIKWNKFSEKKIIFVNEKKKIKKFHFNFNELIILSSENHYDDSKSEIVCPYLSVIFLIHVFFFMLKFVIFSMYFTAKHFLCYDSQQITKNPNKRKINS